MISQQEVIRYAATRGAKVTRAKLVYWAENGLIPAPENARLKGKRGVFALYPEGTEDLVVAVQKVMSAESSTKVARWQLWLRGYAVQGRELLDEALDELREVVDHLDRYEHEALGASVSDDYEYWPDTLAKADDLPPLLLKIRKNVRKADFPAFAVIVSSFLVEPVHEESEEKELAYQRGVFCRAIDTVLPNMFISPPDMYEMAKGFRQLVNVDNIHRILSESSDDELRLAIDEIGSVVDAFSTIFSISALVRGGGQVKELPSFARRQVEIQALLTLGWLPLRQHQQAGFVLSTCEKICRFFGDGARQQTEDELWRRGPDRDSMIIPTDEQSRTSERESFLREMDLWLESR